MNETSRLTKKTKTEECAFSFLKTVIRDMPESHIVSILGKQAEVNPLLEDEEFKDLLKFVLTQKFGNKLAIELAQKHFQWMEFVLECGVDIKDLCPQALLETEMRKGPDFDMSKMEISIGAGAKLEDLIEEGGALFYPFVLNNPKLVEFLIKNGASVHSRCKGKFGDDSCIRRAYEIDAWETMTIIADTASDITSVGVSRHTINSYQEVFLKCAEKPSATRAILKSKKFKNGGPFICPRIPIDANSKYTNVLCHSIWTNNDILFDLVMESIDDDEKYDNADSDETDSDNSASGKDSPKKMGPVHISSYASRNPDILQKLISLKKYKRFINARSDRGITPFYLACMGNKPENLNTLIKAGANAHYSKKLIPPLHVAVMRGFCDVVKILIYSKKIDPFILDDKQAFAYDYAMYTKASMTKDERSDFRLTNYLFDLHSQIADIFIEYFAFSATMRVGREGVSHKTIETFKKTWPAPPKKTQLRPTTENNSVQK